jgi:signal transduction histidine kinase
MMGKPANASTSSLMGSNDPSRQSKATLRRSLSLRWPLAIVVALLALAPNVVMALMYVLPIAGENTGLWSSFAVWLLAIALISVLVGYAVSTLLLQPLTKLADAVSSIAKPGARLAAIQLPDLHDLPVEIETVRAAISSALDALRAEQAKRSAFMATLVHDLKTPIIAANHVLEVIRENENLGRDDRVKLISSLRAENEALLAVVQRMVDAHRFERENIEVQLEPTDLSTFARGLEARFKPSARSKNLSLVVGGSGRALATTAELERACANLLENALRYAKSVIRIEVNGPTLTIADDGPGLQADLDVLAQPFNTQRVQLAGQDFTSGTGGLGLFIARQIVLAHGGTLERMFDRPGTALRITLKPELAQNHGRRNA